MERSNLEQDLDKVLERTKIKELRLYEVKQAMRRTRGAAPAERSGSWDSGGIASMGGYDFPIGYRYESATPRLTLFNDARELYSSACKERPDELGNSR